MVLKTHKQKKKQKTNKQKKHFTSFPFGQKMLPLWLVTLIVFPS